ncbi:MAG: ABC transporter ATP-binding protein, partial [Candidatus Hodarchaeales archaeon]
TLTAKENVQLMAELVYKRLKNQAEHWLSVVGLDQRMDNFPGQLSGGERQRVAIARAIAKEPEILFCDEPTGQLDQKNGKQVIDTLHDVCKTTNTTIVMVTHDVAYKNYADRVLNLEDGKIVHGE